MSSILDALKKLEEEAADETGLPSRMRRKVGAGQRVRFFFGDRAIPLIVAAVLAGTATGGYWGLNRYSLVSNAQRQEPPQTTQAAASAPVQPAEKQGTQEPGPRPDPVSSPVVAAVQVPKPEKTVLAAPVGPVAEAERPAARPAAKPEPPPKQAERHGEATVPSAAPPHPAEEFPEMEGSETIWSGSAPEPEPESDVLYDEAIDEPAEEALAEAPAADPDLPVLRNSDLSLQAISWASAPKDRLAVVNGSICREGDRVGRFVIRKINPDDVVVDDGRATWTLLFQLK